LQGHLKLNDNLKVFVMKTKLISPLALIAFVMAILITCKKSDTDLPPVAKAGPDQVITLPTDSVLLDGSASGNPDGPITKWLWTKISGPSTFTIINSSAPKTRVKNLVEGIYVFELKVTNKSNLTAIDQVVIAVNAQPNPGPLPGPLPVANAGADTSIKLLSCGIKGSVTLNGSRSSDPGTHISGYVWTQISGPSAASFVNQTSAIATAGNLSNGQYFFQLQVFNANGLSSKDTMKVEVTTELTATNLDLTINGGFTFINNYEDCYYGPPCTYYDLTTMDINFNFLSFGPFNCWIYESADTATTSDAHDTYVSLSSTNYSVNSPRVGGKSSINFKKIIQRGGGAFSGTLKIDYGSATTCTPNIYTNLDALSVTGSLDTTARTISLTIQGRTYF
jgi:hypothetical protein